MGAVLKASEGASWRYPTWFNANWPAVRAAAGNRYGVTFWRAAYHYVHFMDNPLAQVDNFMRAVQDAGGWGPGDMRAIVDVERADNPDCSAQQIVDCVSAIATHLQARTGRAPILYGGSLMYDKGITSRMGCEKLWIARYTASLPEVVVTRIGWTEEDLLMWQFCGDGESYLPGYPKTSPIGKCDISAVVMKDGLEWLKRDCAPPDPNWLERALAVLKKLFD